MASRWKKILIQVIFQSLDEGVKIANNLMDKLNVKQEDLISGAYIDLIEMSKPNKDQSSQ